MTIQTIVSDLDDTLLDGSSKLSERTLRVLRECTRRGIHVVPASGRTIGSMEPFMKQLNTGCPYIACNGGQLATPEHTVMEEITMPQELAREICAYLRAEGFYVQAYRNEVFYYDAECEAARNYKESSFLKGEAVGDLLAFLTFPVPKVLSVNAPEEVSRVLPLIREKFAGRAEFTLSKPYFIEALPLGVSKGAALERLSKRMGYRPEETVVFGDSLNDISMFGFTENSVAMGNAREEARKAARYVCRPNTQDGVARFLEENVLG